MQVFSAIIEAKFFFEMMFTLFWRNVILRTLEWSPGQYFGKVTATIKQMYIWVGCVSYQ